MSKMHFLGKSMSKMHFLGKSMSKIEKLLPSCIITVWQEFISQSGLAQMALNSISLNKPAVNRIVARGLIRGLKNRRRF